MTTKFSGTTAGTFTAVVHVTPGQTGTDPNSACGVSAAQGAEGVNCVIGALDFQAGSSGYGTTASAGLFFAPPAVMSTSDTYQTGTGTAAVYSASLTESGAFTASGLPPNSAGNEIPNNGGFATSGVIVQGAPGSPTVACSSTVTTNCIPTGDAYLGGILIDESAGAPATCQAASAPGATAWSGELLCTYGAAVGEPIELALSGYVAPTVVPVGANPSTLPTGPAGGVPVSTGKVLGVSLFPLDVCTVGVGGCTTGLTVSAQAGDGDGPGRLRGHLLELPVPDGADAGQVHLRGHRCEDERALQGSGQPGDRPLRAFGG